MLRRSVLVAVGVVVALLGAMLPAGAQPETLAGVVIEFDSEIVDLSTAQVLRTAEHSGTLRCYGDRCAGKTQLEFTDGATVEYRFKELLTLQTATNTVIAAGEGVISDGDGRQKFAFTAVVFEPGPDVWEALYSASTPVASFDVVPLLSVTSTFFERP